jgi:predicted hotdog family 3-hydroxylacyl-ACP dehydratase
VTTLGRVEIAALIPHAGTMCLLDAVVRWDDTSIACRSARHRDPGNPLRRDDRLAAVCGIEFAAQAMAVHGALAGSVSGRPRAGFLASIRDLVCPEARLDHLAGDLIIEAERLMGDDARVIYQFALRCGEAEVLSGRAAVVLAADPA